jgi:hypothetical protein
MFLVGGPAFSGTTLLALLLNQDELVCLDEPDFHDPAQSHRGIPVLEGLFPDRDFPARPQEPLAYDAAVELIEECERAIHPYDLGVKTCDWPFLAYAEVYERLGHPVVCIVRDIRDALVRPLPEWLTEQGLNERYRMIWARAQAADALVRYEDLVADAAAALGTVSAALGRPLTATLEWPAERVPRQMLKLDRHQLLQGGTISSSRVGVWRSAGRAFSDETHATARLMGYPDS